MAAILLGKRSRPAKPGTLNIRMRKEVGEERCFVMNLNRSDSKISTSNPGLGVDQKVGGSNPRLGGSQRAIPRGHSCPFKPLISSKGRQV